jgi:hypothetical protein
MDYQSDVSFDIAWRFVVATLATWRMTHLLTQEDGPGYIVLRLRARLGVSMLGSLMDCFYCTSVWVALPLTVLLDRPWRESLLLWIAMSGAACLLQRWSDRGHSHAALTPTTHQEAP